MRRRTLLGAVAGAGGAALAGCVGAPESGDPGSASDPSTPDPSVTDSSLRVNRVECGLDSASATVTLDDGTVTVDGEMRGSDGCTRARLDAATYADGTLTVAVESYEETGGVCKQCTTSVRYTATVGMTGAPERVVVTHDGSEVASEAALE